MTTRKSHEKQTKSRGSKDTKEAAVEAKPKSEHAVLVMAKDPVPGRVMTRLCPPLSAQEACELQAACMNQVLAAVAGREDGDIYLAITPDTAVDDHQAAHPEFEVFPQGNGTMGVRLERSVAQLFALGHQRVVVLGTDSPTMPMDRISEAFDWLRDTDVVLGPCPDGGYYLLGLRVDEPLLFSDVEWSGESVISQTMRQARMANLNLRLLAEWYDIDRPPDMVTAFKDMERSGAAKRMKDLADMLRVFAARTNPAVVGRKR